MRLVLVAGLFLGSGATRQGSALIEAQQPSPTFGRYQLDVWRAQDGVRLAFASNLVQTRDGYLWLSSESGVTRFDGVFDGSNTPALRGRPQLQPSGDQGRRRAIELLGRVGHQVGRDPHLVTDALELFER